MIQQVFQFLINIIPHSTVFAQVKDWGDCVTPEGVPTLKCLEVVFGNILFMASGFIVLVLFIMFTMGSFTYLTSFGNPEKVKKAMGTLRFALIGFGLFIGSFLILKIIDIMFLGGLNKIFEFKIGD
ncbi:MAG: hypothetical protein Q7R95_08870 [bacterium]|nr:hypothetical protein [bacterium]